MTPQPSGIDAAHRPQTDAEGFSREPRFTLEAIAVRSGVQPRTILRYERVGLVVAQSASDARRLYSESDLETVRRIRRLIDDLGVNLAGVAAILHLRQQVLSLHRQLHDRDRPPDPAATAARRPRE